MTYDVIIVGGGTAGCVLAARLSERSGRRVALVESGRDLRAGHEPSAIADPFPASYGDPAYAWPELTAVVGADRGAGVPRFSRKYVQGRILGGSSSIMGMMAQRGLPDDYDEWARLGAAGWGWDDVLPYFNKLEHDWDFGGPLHGKTGPIPIRRHARAQWPGFCQAFAEAVQARGYSFLPDLNGQFEDGLSIIPMNNLPDRRVSAASGYLTEEVRRRAGLGVLTETTTQGLLMQGRRAVGIRIRQDGHERELRAPLVIVAAGALHSPALLMRAGIGPGAHLQSLGIDVVADLAGVGRNLLNHPTVHVATHLPPRARQTSALRTWPHCVLRYSSRQDGCPQGDMLLFPANKTSWHALGSHIGAMGVCVYKAYSKGSVTLRSASADESPQVEFNLLSDARDHQRLVDGLRFTLEVFADPAMARQHDEVFLPSGGQANRLNRPSLRNAVESWVAAGLFDAAPALRRRLLASSTLDLPRLLAQPQALLEIVARAAAPVHHVSGTCRIGADGDADAVLDADCRVRGVEGLRVVDASVMPSIVRANTHLTVLMIAEKAAAMMDAEMGA